MLLTTENIIYPYNEAIEQKALKKLALIKQIN